MTRELIATPLATVQPRRQEWAYQDLVPLGVPTILAGRGGIGKSTILAWLAAGLTRGEFAGDLNGEPTAVGFISGEDDLATTLVPRLTAAGANLELVWDLSSVKTTSEDGSEWTALPTIADDIAALKAKLIETGVRVLVIDPVISMMSGDTIKATDVRRNLDPIAGLAADLGIAPILVMHFGKGQGNASDKVSGSHAFRDIARSVLLLAVDEDTDQRILTVDKSNYSLRAPSLAFEVVSAAVDTPDGDVALVGRAALIGETSLTVHELVRRSEDASLGDLSSEILAFVNSAAREIDTSEVVEEFDLQRNQARVYLGRLAGSGRITRTGRGKYIRNAESTPVTPVASVATVALNHPNATHITDATPQQSATQLVTCFICGTGMRLVSPGQTSHPGCSEAVA